MEEQEKKTIEADETEKTDEVKTEEVKTAAELLAAAEQAVEKEEEARKKEKKHPFKKLSQKLNGMDEDKKNLIRNISRITAVAALALCLIVACSVSVYNRKLSGKHAGKGTMISISEVSDGVDPFYGVTFGDRAYSYEEMLYGDMQDDPSVDETSERIQALLAERDAEKRPEPPAPKKKKETKEVYVATDGDVVDIDAQIAYNEKQKASTAVIFVPGTVGTTTTGGTAATAPTAYTFADANGVYQDLGEFVLTAYCPCPICCGQWSNMVNPSTASGNPAVEGVTIAVDTNVIPFGTRIRIGDHIYTAQDRGGAIKGNRIDVYFRTHERACQFGKQTMHVYKVIE